MRKIVTCVLLLFVLFQSGELMAQDMLRGSDLSTLKVDYLSDTDIAKIKKQLEEKNTTLEEVEPMALAKGMSKVEFAKLKSRLGEQQTVKKKVKENEKYDQSMKKYLRMRKEKSK